MRTMSMAIMPGIKGKPTFTKLSCTKVGHHMLDSGDIYGRNYERPVAKGVTVDIDYNEHRDEFYVSASIPLGEFLDAAFTIDAELTRKLRRIEKIEGNRLNSRDAAELLTQAIPGATLGNWENTYNYETDLDQVVQYHTIETEDSGTVYVIETHNGCDVRGGYSNCVVARLDDGSDGYLDYTTSWCVSKAFKNGKENQELLEQFQNRDHSSDLKYILKSDIHAAYKTPNGDTRLILADGVEVDVYATNRIIEGY